MSYKKRKKSALIICRSKKTFWTTQKQLWQWVREGVVIKTKDFPLTGSIIRENEETFIVVQKTVLNLAHPVHLREVLDSKRLMKSKRS